jgi:heme exporter protein D
MSNWFYVGLAYGVTYLALIGYTIHLVRLRGRAEEALRSDPHRREE